MPVWNLEPGMEAPVQTPRMRSMSNLSPADVAKRCEDLGARVDLVGNKYRVYPADPNRGPIFFADRFVGRARSNTVAELRRGGLDVLAESPKGPEVPVKKPATVSPIRCKDEEPRVDAQQQALLEMIAEMESRITDLEERLSATPGAPLKRDPDAELDRAILDFMKSMPIKLSAAVIIANLDDIEGLSLEKVIERLALLVHHRDVVVMQQSTGEKVYRFDVQ